MVKQKNIIMNSFIQRSIHAEIGVVSSVHNLNYNVINMCRLSAQRKILISWNKNRKKMSKCMNRFIYQHDEPFLMAQSSRCVSIFVSISDVKQQTSHSFCRFFKRKQIHRIFHSFAWHLNWFFSAEDTCILCQIIIILTLLLVGIFCFIFFSPHGTYCS